MNTVAMKKSLSLSMIVALSLSCVSEYVHALRNEAKVGLMLAGGSAIILGVVAAHQRYIKYSLKDSVRVGGATVKYENVESYFPKEHSAQFALKVLLSTYLSVFGGFCTARGVKTGNATDLTTGLVYTGFLGVDTLHQVCKTPNTTDYYMCGLTPDKPKGALKSWNPYGSIDTDKTRQSGVRALRNKLNGENIRAGLNGLAWIVGATCGALTKS